MNPLEMPEIAEVISSHLIPEDLAQCILVSKAWYDLFMPALWDTIKLDTRKDPDTGPQPSAIYHHGRLIRSLRINKDVCEELNIHGPILEILESMDFTEMFPLLISLRLDGVHLSPAKWSTLSTHHHLRSIYVCWIEIADPPVFWRLCTNLEQVDLCDCTIASTGIPGDVEFPRMRSLQLNRTKEMDEETQLEVLLRSPNLRDMTWMTIDHDNPRSTKLPVQIQSGHWPHLHTLHLGGGLEDTDLMFVLNGIGKKHRNLRNLHVGGHSLNTQSFNQLWTYFDTIVSLDLVYSYATTSLMHQEILCNCPKLEILRARGILAKDIATGAPWRCQRLQELQICIQFGRSDENLHPLVFERLSTLVRLERLTLYHPLSRFNGDYGVLKLRLDSGLSKLATLQHLTEIEFGYIRTLRYYPQMGLEEVHWMVDNLKNLGIVYGHLNEDHEKNHELVWALRERGVSATLIRWFD
ncbi:hypothetical protein BGX31_001242 [Mortierella sp. GBA43]|nr:hypothetical protein BGX31_001242 [Mortierella sp. GBA43]